MSTVEIRNSKFEIRSNLEARNSKQFRWFLSFLLLCSSFGVLSGCATTGEEEQTNYSERPWNTPRSWETGLPSTLNEGR